MTYLIGKINILVEGVVSTPRQLRAFITSEASTPETLKLSVQHVSQLPQTQTKAALLLHTEWHDRGESGPLLVMRHSLLRFRVAHMEADPGWTRFVLKLPWWNLRPRATLRHLLEPVFRYGVVQHGGIVLHASGLRTAYGGLLMTGPSGTGKSTQARLWKTLRGAEVLNSDRPALVPEGNGFHIWGLPWSGSDPVYRNESEPLRAVFVLEQANQNRCERMDSQDAVRALAARAFLPYCLPERMPQALQVLEKICGGTPVYKLSCTPDEQAIEVVEQCLES